ncbi:MAG TPA: hypothetical protein VNK05_16150 [Chloroflexota bacterium]|nr:hypothetical protein [Chloroflexota bacterium]
MVAVTAEGRLYHTVRHADGRWDRWGERERPSDDPFVAVTCAGSGDSLQVGGVTAEGRLYHTVRHADGRWDRWGRPSSPDAVRAVASA